MKRTLSFSQHRKFVFFGKDWHDKQDIIYFISAIAVQISFGLDKYLLSHFKSINLTKSSYVYNQDSSLLQGHVEYGEIYLSWYNTFNGVKDTDDKHNVGLHEMAHALTYESFNAGGRGDWHFKNEFANFTRTTFPIFEKLQLDPNNFLGQYATTNFNEFWAVSVEVFFEQPVKLKESLPNLYEAITKLLNQDIAYIYSN